MVTLSGINYYVDLVFYNKILHSYILIDLKINRLKPDNFGQMNMYLNYYKNEINDENDQAPIGIILCADKEKTLAELSILGLQNNIYATKYTTVMLDIEILQNEVDKVVKMFDRKSNK